MRVQSVHRTEGQLPSGSAASRINSEDIAVGEPMHLQGIADFKRDVESSLEIIAKKRMLDAESQARSLVDSTRRQAEMGAAQIVLAANRRADEILAEMQASVDKIREEAQEQGFKAGFEEGYADATAQFENDTVELVKSAEFLMEGAQLAEKKVLGGFKKHALELVELVANRVIDHELSITPGHLLHLIEEGIESLYLTGKVKVVLNPHSLHELRLFSSKIDAAMDSLNRLEMIADPMLEPYQLYVIGQEGSFDISPINQVTEILRQVEAALPKKLTEAHVAREIAEADATELAILTSSAEASEKSDALAHALSDDIVLKPLSGMTLPISELQQEADETFHSAFIPAHFSLAVDDDDAANTMSVPIPSPINPATEPDA